VDVDGSVLEGRKAVPDANYGIALSVAGTYNFVPSNALFMNVLGVVLQECMIDDAVRARGDMARVHGR